jgi:hypothetical protein
MPPGNGWIDSVVFVRNFRSNEMKAKIFKAVGLLGGFTLIGVGSAAIFGDSIIAYAIGVGCVVAIIWLWEDADKRAKQAVADERKRLFDEDIAQGNKVNYGGKDWRQGCRIDPETGAMIEPGV